MGFWDILSAIGSLVLIVAILVLTYFASRWYARRMGAGGAGRHIRIIDRAPVGARASVAIVRVEDKHYLIGIGDKGVDMLCELPDFAPRLSAEEEKDQSFRRLFSDLMDKARQPRK